MSIAHSKLTSQGQISIPAEIRRRLGLEAGSVIEWVDEGGRIVVRPVGRFDSEDIHKAVFPEGPGPAADVKAMKSAVRDLARKRHARGRY